MKESIRQIITVQRAHAIPAAEAVQYPKWDDKYRLENLRETIERVASIRIDFSDLTDAECEMLGFGLWTRSETDPLNGMRLIPLYLFDHIAAGQVLYCINGDKVVSQVPNPEWPAPNRIDNDHRGGMLAYGFIPKDATK